MVYIVSPYLTMYQLILLVIQLVDQYVYFCLITKEVALPIKGGRHYSKRLKSWLLQHRTVYLCLLIHQAIPVICLGRAGFRAGMIWCLPTWTLNQLADQQQLPLACKQKRQVVVKETAEAGVGQLTVPGPTHNGALIRCSVQKCKYWIHGCCMPWI